MFSDTIGIFADFRMENLYRSAKKPKENAILRVSEESRGLCGPYGILRFAQNGIVFLPL